MSEYKREVRIIIVDDEPISADYMSDLVRDEFESTGLVHLRTAYNAATVLRMVEEEPCDVLVCDIQMPGMNGLALAAELRKAHPQMCIIFLTGYDDFQYTYEAFKQNAAHYLLKTEGDEVILGAIRQAIEQLLSQRRISARIHEAEERYLQLLPAHRRQLLMQRLLGMGGDDEESLFAEKLYLMVGRAADPRGAKLPTRSSLVALSAVERTMEDALGDKLAWAEGFALDSDLVWCFAMREEQPYADIFFQLARKARAQLENELGITMFMVVAEEETTIDQLDKKYTSICSMLSREIQYGATGVAIRRPPRTQAVDQQTLQKRLHLRRQAELCMRDVKEGAFDGLQRQIQPVLAYCREHLPKHEPVALEMMAALTASLLTYINENALSASVEPGGYFSPLESINWVERTVERLAHESAEQVNDASKSIVAHVLEYIRQHISEEISMTRLTEHTGYSSGYLSRVFKQEQNVSIHEYVTMSRMNLARELLCNTNLRIYEIASSCGYDNTTYFIRVFKNATGMTPQEYKNDVAQRGRRGNM